jgi:magnesium transporter
MVARSHSEKNEILWKRDLVALRDMLKNWSPSALVRVMTELAIEDLMNVRRILPRELAAEAFESLDLPGQERLLKAVGQEELAALLSNMAPDDRTCYSESYLPT